MSISKLVALLVILTFTLKTSAIDAQTVLKGTLHHFDTTSKRWADPDEIHYVFKNSQGSIDSVLRIKFVTPELTSLERFYDWRPVNNDIKLETLDGFDRRFKRPGYQNHVAGRRDSYAIRYYDTFLVEQKSISFLDSQVLLQEQHVFGPDGFVKIDSFFRDEIGRVYRHRSITSGAHYNEDRLIEKLWIRDGSGRVVGSVDKEFGRTQDSILYEYAADGTLKTMTHHSSFRPLITKYEYNGWRTFESEIPIFQRGPVVGGTGFETQTMYIWDEDSAALRLYGIGNQEFDELDRVVRSAGIGYYEIDSQIRKIHSFDTITFYESGEEKSHSRWNSRYNTLYVNQYFNTYDLKGELVLSDYYSWGRPLRRVHYEQLQSDVQWLANRNYDTPNVGKSLRLSPEPTMVSVYNLLGLRIVHSILVDDLDLSHLPSGLYFISIDGGKPRKHLVP